MVNILASCLSGATLIVDPERTPSVGVDIGHSFMAIDPSNIFRARATSDRCVDVSWAPQGHDPVDQAQPVMVNGDPQWETGGTRRA
jgi:LDH2 family malate/lactate/ureidoglycolate dehydrogenase